MLHNQRASQDHATADVDDEHGHERKKFWALSSSSFAFTCGTRTHLLLLRLLLLRQLAQDEGVRWCPRRHHPGDADPGSARTPGRSPEQAVFCARRPSYFTRPPITAVMQAAASSIATVCRSCRNIERSSRSRFRFAEEVPAPSTFIMSTADVCRWATQKRKEIPETNAGGGGRGVVLVRTRCMTTMFIHESQRIHRIEVAGHLRVRLPATPPPRALDDEELFIIEG